MKDESFFTPAMGARLRSLRIQALLTQDEVAERMGLTGKSRNRYVNALERGRVGNPSLRTIALFLRACDSHWSEFTDLLVIPKPLPFDTTAIDEAGFSPDRRDRVRSMAAREADKYSYKAQMPGRLTRKGTKPLPLARRQAMALRLRDYRIVVNIIEEDVRNILATTPSATAIDVGFYQAAAREVLGLFWQQAKQRRKPSPAAVKEFLSVRLATWVSRGFDGDAITRVQTQTIRRFEQLQADHPELFRGK